MKISIITINFNDRNGLLRTIKSVVSQTFNNYEFIIIDGGSKDGSVEVIKEYEDFIDYWVSEPDKGIYNAMNKGVMKAHGEYCIFMNSADCFCNSDVLGKWNQLSDDSDIICGNTLMPDRIHAHELISFKTLFEGCIGHQCAFIRTALLKKYPYDESLKIVSDRKFFLQALIFDNCTYQAIDLDIVNYDITGLSSRNRFLSDKEYQFVLETMIPERIRLDYGHDYYGDLYGDSDYDKLFIEIRKRSYKKIVYVVVVTMLRFVAVFRKSASFIKSFPFSI